MDYLTYSGYNVQYKIKAVRKQLGTDREYSVSVELGDEIIEGTNTHTFAAAEEKLLVGLLSLFRGRLEDDKRKRLLEESKRESNDQPREADATPRVESFGAETQVPQAQAS